MSYEKCLILLSFSERSYEFERLQNNFWIHTYRFSTAINKIIWIWFTYLNETTTKELPNK